MLFMQVKWTDNKTVFKQMKTWGSDNIGLKVILINKIVASRVRDTLKIVVGFESIFCVIFLFKKVT